jgi:hypothetical protein
MHTQGTVIHPPMVVVSSFSKPDQAFPTRPWTQFGPSMHGTRAVIPGTIFSQRGCASSARMIMPTDAPGFLIPPLITGGLD